MLKIILQDERSSESNFSAPEKKNEDDGEVRVRVYWFNWFEIGFLANRYFWKRPIPPPG